MAILARRNECATVEITVIDNEDVVDETVTEWLTGGSID